MLKKISLVAIFTFLSALIVSANEKYLLDADQVTRLDNFTYKATGNVILKAKDIVFKSDTLIYHQNVNEIEAYGNVTVKSQTQEIEADRITYNLNNESGTAENIKGFLAPFNYICAKKLDRTGPTTFTIEEARITTCPGNIPDWSVSMFSGKMELGGYINANHATADILNTPIVYAPKLLYPVSTERQSGFLIPGVGYSSDKGAFLNIKYFWAPDIDFDLTAGLGLYSKSGVQEQIEARYALSDNSNFYAAFERIDDATSAAPSIVRWRATLKNQYVPIKNLQFNVNADYVSDYLYMRDFDSFSIMQYNNNNKDNVFFDEAKISFFSEYANIFAQYRHDFEFRDTATGYFKTQVEQIPSISIKKTIPILPYLVMDYGLSFDGVQYKQDSYNTPSMTDKVWNYKRAQANAKLYFPIDLKILTLTPALSAKYTFWFDSSTPFEFKDYSSPVFGGVQRLSSKSAQRYSATADLNIAFKQIYRNFGPVTHGMLNTIKLRYSPTLAQSPLPSYLEDDIVDDAGSLTYEMVNFLQGENWNLRLTLNQGYDFLKESKVLPLNGKLYFSLFKIVDNTFEIKYNHSGPLTSENESRMQYVTDTLGLNITEYFRLIGTYTYDATIKNSYNTSAELNGRFRIWRIAVNGYYKWQAENKSLSFHKLAPIELGGGIAYYAECWSLGVDFQRNMYKVNTKNGQTKQKETIIYLTFSLKGIGDSRLQFLKFKNNDQ